MVNFDTTRRACASQWDTEGTSMPGTHRYYFYLRDGIDGLVVQSPQQPSHGYPRDLQQAFGILLLCATVTLPVALAGAIAFALKLVE